MILLFFSVCGAISLTWQFLTWSNKNIQRKKERLKYLLPHIFIATFLSILFSVFIVILYERIVEYLDNFVYVFIMIMAMGFLFFGMIQLVITYIHIMKHLFGKKEPKYRYNALFYDQSGRPDDFMSVDKHKIRRPYEKPWFNKF